MDTQELEALYTAAFPKVAAMVRRYGGDLETARDVFHEAMLVLMEAEEPRSAEAYLMGIARNLLRRQTRQIPMADLPEDVTEAPVQTAPMAIWSYVRGRCLDLLKAFYDRGDTMERIAFTYGYSSAHSATVQKYKCIEKLREQLKTSGIYEEVFA
ncbi:MAG TPA: sigma factor [Dinghuibacter sp.]|jgi:DNA-directed RNA polymerase specialized sigma24 family protein|uniref:RNA polymerase sigma factor n=1 Tax=Dinghuibacter sp. TaxID=2024697 RepID=UPI002C0E3E55|nr:sigma factor [Dinghuibacter sp.]HTJ14858.1 sigma factor [Dinghuibacter sp.]